MPYITTQARAELDNELRKPSNAGEINYVVTRKVLRKILEKGISYQTFIDIDHYLHSMLFDDYYSGTNYYILSTIEKDIQAEIYRRIIKPYEELKIAVNGDVPGYEMLQKQLARLWERRHVRQVRHTDEK